MNDLFESLYKMSGEELVAYSQSVGHNFDTGKLSSINKNQFRSTYIKDLMRFTEIAEMTTKAELDEFSELGEDGVLGMIDNTPESFIATKIKNAGLENDLAFAVATGGFRETATLRSQANKAGLNLDKIIEESGGYVYEDKFPTKGNLKHIENLFSGLTGVDASRQDILGRVSGYADETFVDREFGTKFGSVDTAMEKIAEQYMNHAMYNNRGEFRKDLSRIKSRLFAELPSRLKGMELAIADKFTAKSDSWMSYADALPTINEITSGIAHPSFGFNRRDFKDVVKEIAKVYGISGAATNDGFDTGLSYERYNPSEHLNVYNELALQSDDWYSIEDNISTLNEILEEENITSVFDITSEKSEDILSRIEGSSRRGKKTFNVSGGKVQDDSVDDVNKAQLRMDNNISRKRAAIEDADKVAASLISGTFGDITFHDVQQGSQEWKNLRSGYITGSEVGGILGSKYSNYEDVINNKAMTALGVTPPIQTMYSHHFERGHKLEEIARQWYETGYSGGSKVSQTGFITNTNYPHLGVSPDGLIGEQGLFEAKAPERDFFEPKKRPDYLNQVQQQMLVSDRQYTDLVQVLENKYNKDNPYSFRVDRIQRDNSWFEKNRDKLEQADKDFKSRLGNTDNQSSNDTGNLADAVKKGSVAAHMELIERGVPALGNSGGGGKFDGFDPNNYRDADFEDLDPNGMGSGAWYKRARDVLKGRKSEWGDSGDSGGSGNGNGNGGGNTSGGLGDAINGGVGGLFQGLKGGSLQSILSGGFAGLGKGGAVGGAMQMAIGGGMAAYGIQQTLNDFVGASLDSGMGNPYGFMSSRQTMIMSGMNDNQAINNTANIANAAGDMSAGFFDNSINLVRGSRGLIGFNDIWESRDNPQMLLQRLYSNAKDRGLDQRQVSALARQMGLVGGARGFQLTDEQQTEIFNMNKEAGAEDGQSWVNANRDIQFEVQKLNPTTHGVRLGSELQQASASGIRALVGNIPDSLKNIKFENNFDGAASKYSGLGGLNGVKPADEDANGNPIYSAEQLLGGMDKDTRGKWDSFVSNSLMKEEEKIRNEIAKSSVGKRDASSVTDEEILEQTGYSSMDEMYDAMRGDVEGSLYRGQNDPYWWRKEDKPTFAGALSKTVGGLMGSITGSKTDKPTSSSQSSGKLDVDVNINGTIATAEVRHNGELVQSSKSVLRNNSGAGKAVS